MHAGKWARHLLTVPAALLMVVAAQPLGVLNAAATTCLTAGATGMTAAVVAAAGDSITGTVNATGCDIGIYVPPGADGVIVAGATISGAKNQGVVAQDVSDFMLMWSDVTGNGTNPTAGISDDKAVTLVGTTRAAVHNNTVSNNTGGGGIALTDDGAVMPAAPAGHSGSVRPSLDNMIMDNVVSGNLFGCGIVLAAWNVGGGILDNTVMGNEVSGAPGAPPAIGAIVVAADAPFTTALDNVVVGNTVTSSLIPGIIAHSNAPGDLVSGTVIRGNTVSGNDFGMTDGPAAMVGIAVRANTFGPGVPAAVLTRTLVTENRISDEDYGIWLSGATDTQVAGWGLNKADTPLYPQPQQCGHQSSSANC